MLKRFTSALARLSAAGGEPRHEGRPARWWLKRLEDEAPPARAEAVAAFAAMGPAAIPGLLDRLRASGEEKRQARRLADGLAAIRPEGMQMLFRALMADPKHPALAEAYRQIIAGRVEDLIPLMRDDDAMRDALVDWLRHEGARIIPTLLFFLNDESTDVRVGVMATLVRMLQATTPLPPAGFDRLLAAMDDADARVRAGAAAALAFTGERAAGAVGALRRGLDDEHAAVRLACAKTLGAIGPPAIDALPAVLALSDNALVAAQVAGRLAAGGNPEACAAIRDSFSTPELTLHRAGALAWAGAPDGDTLAVLMDALKEDNLDRAAFAIKALGALGPAAAEAMSTLARLRRERPFDGALEWPLHEAILSIKKKGEGR